MTYELGSMIIVALYVLVKLIVWIKSRGGKEVEYEYSNLELARLASQMDGACGKIDALTLEQTKTHMTVKEVWNDIHNGLSSDIKEIKEIQNKQWKAIGANASDVAYLKGMERRKHS